jgi:nitrogen fixation/metabolism regulation signal transduction histidine kinase
VAAWRELARRLAHELKNPLFPLQITIENLQRARTARPEEFEDIFNESTVTLLEEVKNLQTIIGRFSEFARMPIPQFERMDVNDVLRSVVKLYDPQLTVAKIDTVMELAPGELAIEADPEQLRRAFGNLVLNAIDAMKQGGRVVVRTAAHSGWVRIEISDGGEGLTDEECQRLFTPYYTTKQHGTGLGLAIVQGVVSDHHGQIAVESAPGKGTTFLVDLHVKQPPQRERA